LTRAANLFSNSQTQSIVAMMGLVSSQIGGDETQEMDIIGWDV
jgi:hypothetical protein